MHFLAINLIIIIVITFIISKIFIDKCIITDISLFVPAVFLPLFMSSILSYDYVYNLLYITVIIITIIISISLSPTINIKHKLFIFYVIKTTHGRLLNIVLSILSIMLSQYYTKKPENILGEKLSYVFLNNGIRITHNFQKLPLKPTIFVCNYAKDRIENSMCVLIPRKLSILMQSGFKSFIPNIIHRPIFVHGHGNGNLNYVKDEIQKSLDNNCCMFVYITKPDSRKLYTRKPRKGIYIIAKELGATVTPVYFDSLDHKNGIIPNQNLNIVVGDTFKVEDINVSRYETLQFFKKSLIHSKKTKYNFI